MKMPAKKRLFIGLISGSTLLVLGLLALVYYLFIHREQLLNQVFLVLIGVVLLGVLFAVAFGIGGIVLTLWSARTFPPLQGFTRVAINLTFPLAIVLGKIMGISQSVIQSSFIEVNNQMVRTQKMAVPPEKLLVLTPHCLQRSECPRKITLDIQNCKRCGLCPVSSLLELTERYGVKLAIATGGTFARRFVEQYRPQAIVAIACERDLSSGIMDTNPLPVLGVLNQRPHGPCFNTQVDLGKLEQSLMFMLNLKEPIPAPESESETRTRAREREHSAKRVRRPLGPAAARDLELEMVNIVKVK